MTAKEVVALLEKDHIFLTGGAGTGKTTLCLELISAYESIGKKVARLASTGMAATLLQGQTLHSFLDLGIANDMESLAKMGKIPLKKRVKKLITSMHLIIIDEISMVSASLFTLIHWRLKQAGFKGRVVVVGDFLQLPPVTKKSALHFAFESEAWEAMAFHVCYLEKIYRSSDELLLPLLHAVRFATLSSEQTSRLDALIKPIPASMDDITVLYGYNRSAKEHNAIELDKMASDAFSFAVEVISHSAKSTQEQIDRFIQESNVDELLTLKIGAPVLFTRNAWNYFNGERGIVVAYDHQSISVKKADETIIKVQTAATTKSRWVEKEQEGEVSLVEEQLFTIYQYPLTLAFALTIHKSQGMSIENVLIQTQEIFAPSQFYVAISRAISYENITLIAPNKTWQQLCFLDEKAKRFMHQLYETYTESLHQKEAQEAEQIDTPAP